MRTVEDIENYLVVSGYPHERIGEGMWRVSDEVDEIDNIIVVITGNVLTCQVKLFDLPENASNELLRRMLEMNAVDLVHGAFALNGTSVLLTESLELDNLDRNELQATIEAMAMGIRLSHQEIRALLNS